jgi:hypothetical protein
MKDLYSCEAVSSVVVCALEETSSHSFCSYSFYCGWRMADGRQQQVKMFDATTVRASSFELPTSPEVCALLWHYISSIATRTTNVHCHKKTPNVEWMDLPSRHDRIGVIQTQN